MIIDSDTRRPKKPDIVYKALPYVNEEKAIGVEAKKLTFKGDSKLIDQRTVRLSELDMNGHVNNSKYVEWIFDSLSGLKNQKEISNFSINYISEARLDENIDIYKIECDREILISGIRSADNKTIFIAEVS